MAIKYELLKEQSSLGKITLIPEKSENARYSANLKLPGYDIIPYKAIDDETSIESEANIYVKILQKPKPCDYRNFSKCDKICDEEDWMKQAKKWFEKFKPATERHHGWHQLWYWFPNLQHYLTNWPSQSGFRGSVFRKNGHEVDVSFVNHLRYYEIPKAISASYNNGVAKPNPKWLKSEWERLWNCFKQANDIREVVFRRRDPVAQTFFTDEQGIFLAGFGVFFEKYHGSPITVFLQETSNGYPNSGKILASKILSGDDINVSNDGTAETIFLFDDLIYLEPEKEFSVCVFSPDPADKLFVAKMGEEELSTGNIITKQPAAGVFFQSPNNSTWVAFPRTDMKFRIYLAEFDPFSQDDYILEFNEVSGIEFSIFNFDVPIVLPESTQIIPEYSIDGGNNWKRFILGENVELDRIYTSLKIRLHLLGNRYVSPIIKEVGSLKLIKYRPRGRYIIRTLETIEQFENCRILFMANVPNNTSITPYYSIDDGENWIEITDYSTVNLDGIWTEYDFKKENIFPAINKLKLKIEMETSDLSKTPKIKDLRMLLY